MLHALRCPLICLSGALSLAAPAAADPPQVVADIAPVHALVAQVMQGSGAAPELILPAGQSPHHAAMRPSQARALAGAGLLVRLGSGLSPALDRAVLSAEPAVTLSLIEAPGTVRLPRRAGAVFDSHDHGADHDHVASDHEAAESGGIHAHEGESEEHADAHDTDHDHGPSDNAAADRDAAHAHAEESAEHADAHDDEHAHEAEMDAAATDLHAWLDPANAALWLAAIADRLAALDPDNAALYRANAAAAQAELAALSDEIAARLAPLAAERFMLLHDSTAYFESRFGLQAAGALSSGDADRPGPARLAEVRRQIDAANVACLIAEPQQDRALVERISAETGVPVVTLDPLGAGLEPGATLYPEVLQALADGFADCLGG